MSDTVITFDSVSKCYNIRERGYRSLRGSFSGSVSRFLQRVVPKKRNNVLSRTNDDMIYALNNVSFEVGKREALGIIGANGSGKTTILRLLSNVTEPSSGKISVRGKVAPLIQVGAGFHPELTGRENVYLNATIMGLSKREIHEKYDDIVSFAELERFMDTPVKRYSSGMYVRLGFAVIAKIDPDILLIDEILSVGDISFQRKCLDTMSKIRKSDKSIVFVSHNLFSIETISDRVIVLNNGEISYMGKPADAIKFYENSMLTASSAKGSLSPDGTQWNTEEFTIKKVTLLNSHDRPIEKIKINESLKIMIDWECTKRMERPGVTLNLFKDDGIRVCVERSIYHGHTFDPFEGSGTVIIWIKRLPLKRGKYTIAITIADLNLDMYLPVVYHRKKSFFVEDNISTISEGIVSIGEVAWSQLDSDRLC